jgi:hypothetical protein
MTVLVLIAASGLAGGGGLAQLRLHNDVVGFVDGTETVRRCRSVVMPHCKATHEVVPVDYATLTPAYALRVLIRSRRPPEGSPRVRLHPDDLSRGWSAQLRSQ